MNLIHPSSYEPLKLAKCSHLRDAGCSGRDACPQASMVGAIATDVWGQTSLPFICVATAVSAVFIVKSVTRHGRDCRGYISSRARYPYRAANGYA